MMKAKAYPNPITTLFVDIGGVLLTNGWDHISRQLAAKAFKLDLAEMEERHQLIFSTAELGKISFEDYLNTVVFYKKRSFTRLQFRKFIFAQSQPYSQMIHLIQQLRTQYGLKIVAVSNEVDELNTWRIQKFKLGSVIDFFISSCVVHLRKPDADIFRLALDIAQVSAAEVVYIEDRPMFVQVAKNLGIQGICHTDYSSTCAKLALFGLKSDYNT
jgi:putative hydrolase of the HAD superfamily